MSLAVDEIALDELAVDEMAADELTPHSILVKNGLNFAEVERHALKNVSNCLNTNIYSYLETSGGQSSFANLNYAHFFNTRVDYKSVGA